MHLKKISSEEKQIQLYKMLVYKSEHNSNWCNIKLVYFPIV